MKKIGLLLALVVLLPLASFSQNYSIVRSDWGDIRVNIREFTNTTDSLLVDFDLLLEDLRVGSNKNIEIVPFIKGELDSLYLPKISLKGSRKAKEFKREMALSSPTRVSEFLEDYLIIQEFDKKYNRLRYRYSVASKEWMDNSDLGLIFDFCGCGVGSENTLSHLIAEMGEEEPKEDFVITPEVEQYIEPKQEVVKERMKEGIAYLDFVVNKIVIDPWYRNNANELNKIDALFSNVSSGKGVSINKVDIIGYASPEGTYNWNQWLSTGRAKALSNYISNKFGLNERMFYLQFGGENWEGLVEMVNNSNMQYKGEVLSIIENYSIFGGREKKLMDLRRGDPYRYMLKYMFPALRKSICRVYYTVSSFSNEEVEDVIKTHPENLSLYEMYDYAKTDSFINDKEKAFENVYEKAAETFPKEDIANINAAQSSITNGQMRQAEAYLKRVEKMKNSAEYLNAMALVKLYHGNIEEAVSIFKQAEKIGSEAARKNLSQIEEYKSKSDNYGGIVF